MTKSLYRRPVAESWLLAAFFALLGIGPQQITVAKSTNVPSAVAIPQYGDTTTWGVYFRQLQDTVATSWYKEIFYYGYPRTVTRGVVTARYSIAPSGKIVPAQILSNTSNQPMGGAVIRSLRKTWMPPFPQEVVAKFPNGLVIDQAFRFNEYDRTNYGFASSYPQTLLRRSPELGNTKYLDIRKYPDLSVFRYQSRILGAVPATTNRIAAQ